jgi:hypothetical protein
MIFRGGIKTVENTFTNIAGGLFDPDSHSIQLYNPLGVAVGTAEVAPTKISLGVFRQNFTIAVDAVLGRYIVQWSIIVGGIARSDNFAFEVVPMSYPTVQEVRDYLGGIAPRRLTDQVIEIQIPIAAMRVNSIKSSAASEELISKTILLLAGYLSYQAYAAEYERTTGSVPGAILMNLARYEDIANEFLTYVQQGIVSTADVGVVNAPIKTFWQEYRDGAYS